MSQRTDLYRAALSYVPAGDAAHAAERVARPEATAVQPDARRCGAKPRQPFNAALIASNRERPLCLAPTALPATCCAQVCLLDDDEDEEDEASAASRAVAMPSALVAELAAAAAAAAVVDKAAADGDEEESDDDDEEEQEAEECEAESEEDQDRSIEVRFGSPSAATHPLSPCQALARERASSYLLLARASLAGPRARDHVRVRHDCVPDTPS